MNNQHNTIMNEKLQNNLNEKVEKESKVKEIFPGVFFKKTFNLSSQSFDIEIANKMFQIVKISIDFSNSEKLSIEDSKKLTLEITLEPFEERKIAKLLLQTGWKIKTKFKYTRSFPSIEAQLAHLAKPKEVIDDLLTKTKVLKDINNNDFTELNFFDFLMEKKWVFIDHEFPPNMQSIGLTDHDSFLKYQVIFHFRRSSTIFFKKEIDVNKDLPIQNIVNFDLNITDIKQGSLDNCWVVSAIAALTRHPKLINRIFITKKPNKYGYFKLKLCKMNVWNVLSIDDYLPCFPMADPVFAAHSKNDIWPSLIEKVLAKMYGSYEKLEVGETQNTFINLTGCPSFSYNLQNDSSFNWEKFCEYFNKGFLLTVGSKNNSELNLEENGLIPEHSYNISKVYNDDDLKLIQISTGLKADQSWKGKWADSSDSWSKDILQKVSPNFDSDKLLFWISWKELLQFFNSCTVCMVYQWEELNLKGKFVTAKSQNNPSVTNFCSRWFYQLTVNEKSKIIIGVHQEDERLPGGDFTCPFLDIGIAIGKLNAENQFTLLNVIHPEFVRQTYKSNDLEPGVYAIIPFSTGISMNFPKNKNLEEIEFDVKNQAFCSAIRQIFSKFDTNLNRQLSYSEIKIFYKMMDREISESDYGFINERYGKRNPQTGTIEGISEKGFFNLFLSLIGSKPKSDVVKMFDKFGFDEHLFSYRSRTFVFSCHSDKPQHIKMLDGLDNNIDFLLHQEIIKKDGIKSEKVKIKSKNSDNISCYKFLNE